MEAGGQAAHGPHEQVLSLHVEGGQHLVQDYHPQVGPRHPRQVGGDGHAQGQEFSVRVERQLGGRDVVATVLVGDEALAPFGRPLDRPSQPLRRPQDQGVLGIDAAAHPEASAHFPSDHPQVALRHPEDLVGEQCAQAVRRLDPRVKRVAARAPVPFADRAARLERRRGHARDHEVEARDVGSARERARHRVLVARLPDEGHVVGRLGPHRRRARPRGVGRRGDGRQGIVVDRDQLRRVDRLIGSRGDHERHRVADVAHAVADQRRPRCRERRRSVAPLARLVGRQIAEPVRREVGAREDGEDPRRSAGVRGIEGPDPRVGMGRADDDGVGLVRQAHVVRVAPEAVDEARVLQTTHGLSDGEFLDGHQITHDGAAVYARSRAAERDAEVRLKKN